MTETRYVFITSLEEPPPPNLSWGPFIRILGSFMPLWFPTLIIIIIIIVVVALIISRSPSLYWLRFRCCADNSGEEDEILLGSDQE
jgi:uncharacterized SAM-binding protein YcdF (DUF218 family)